MEALSDLIAIAVLVSLLGLLLLPFRRHRRKGIPLVIGGLAISVLAAFLLGRSIEKEAIAAGFNNLKDRRLAQEAGITDAKAFYADVQGIRERVEQKRRAEKEAREKAARAEQEATEVAELARRRKEAREAAEAITELATAAPLDQQPRPNPEFGSGSYRYDKFLRTAAGYPFVRLREDVPFCTHPYAVKEATDALKAKDYRWLNTISVCKLVQKGTAVEWSKESVGGLAVVGVRVKTADGGRLTAYAPDFSEAGIPFWMGFYDLAEMRARPSAQAR